MLCASCGSTLPPEARFCPSCGAKATGAGGATVAPSTRASTPRHERRLLTVMFGDLVGFTSASDGADPEDVRARVRPFQDLVRQEVALTGGTVARVVGDGVMVVWGYPTAREDDAMRAIRAALAIRKGVAALGNEMHARIGINSGEAVVTFDSDDERADDAMGDAVNVAARLASGAPIDGIVVGAATATLAGSALEAEAVAPMTLKGKAHAVPAFLVHGIAEGRDAVGASPFVGRSAELALLREACASADVERGLVRALISGEPGIGKSRLLAELHRERLAGDATLWLTGRCRPNAGAPAWALGEIVKTQAGIGDDATPAAALASLEAMLPRETVERGWIRDRLAQLVGATAGAAPSTDELSLVWGAFLAAVARDRTVVVQIEDIHWADPELLAILTGAILGTVGTAVVLLLTARPEVLGKEPNLAAACRVHVALSALAADDSDELIATLASGLVLAPADRLRIIGRSGGNPLFAGELVRLIAQGRGGALSAGGQELLPETVQAVIAARLDLLSSRSRAVARDGAVVGASFWRGSVEALATVDGGAADLGDAIDELIRLEFIRPRAESSLPGDDEYAFRHALVRDVAYGQLTRRDRAVRHAASALWLAEQAGPDRGDLAGIVADHDLRAIELAGSAGDAIDEGSVREHAWRYLMLAGRYAAGVDIRAAVDRYRTAAEIAPSPGARLEALRALAATEADAGAYADAIVTAEIGMPLADELGSVETRAALQLTRSRARRPLGDGAWSHDIGQAIELLEQRPPTATLVEAYAQQTFVEMSEGSGLRLLDWANKAIAIAEQLGVAPPAAALGRRGFARAMLGDRGGEDDLRRAIDIARAGGDSVVLASAVSDLGGAYAYRGDTPQVEAQVRESIEIARTRGLRGIEAAGVYNLAHVMRVSGRFDEALVLLDQSSIVAVASQDRIRPFFIERERVLTLEARGDLDTTGEMAEEIALRVPGGAWADSLATLEVLWAAQRGHPDTVREAFGRVYLQDVEDDLDAAEAINYLPIARAVIAAGMIDLAARVLPTVSSRSPIGAAVHDALAGLILAASGSEAAAEQPLRRAIAFWDEANFRPEGAQARQTLAGSLGVLGRHDEATAVLAEAAAAWSGMSAPRRVADCDAKLAELQAVWR